MTQQTTTKSVYKALVYYDPDTNVSGGNRWFDAFGPSVAKYVTDFTVLPADDTSADPTEYTVSMTEVGAGTSSAVITDAVGGSLLITTAGNEDDGCQMQLGTANAGEWVSFDTYSRTYFGIRFQINDVDQTDNLFGVCVTDSDCLGAVTDGMYFRSVDASAVLNFVLEKDSVENAVAVDTMADATWVTAEWYYDGTSVYVYIDGALVTTIARTNTSFPNDELLRLTLEFLTGEATANTCTIDWVRLIQIRPA